MPNWTVSSHLSDHNSNLQQSICLHLKTRHLTVDPYQPILEFALVQKTGDISGRKNLNWKSTWQGPGFTGHVADGAPSPVNKGCCGGRVETANLSF